MSKPKIAVISGSGGVGKDTFVEFIKNNYPFGTICNISTVDNVKVAARQLGWDGVKNEKGREFLAELKYLASKYYPISTNVIYECISENPRASCIFVHCREPQEIGKIKEEFDAITILVKNQNIVPPRNYADQHCEEFEFDYIIDNNGTLYDLEKSAKAFITNVLL